MNYYVEESKLLNFIYGDFNSRELKMIITKSNHHDQFEKDYELVEVPGRKSALLIDNKRNKVKVIELEAYIDCDELNSDVDSVIKSIEAVFSGDLSFKLLKFSDSSKFLEGMCSKITYEEEIEGLLKVDMKFECQGYNNVEGLDSNLVITAKDSILFNSGNGESEPYIKVYGSGDVTIYINNPNMNQTLILKELTDFLEVDCRQMNCYRTDNTGALIPKNNQMYSDFPYILPGETTISWLGNITKIEINPRWINM